MVDCMTDRNSQESSVRWGCAKQPQGTWLYHVLTYHQEGGHVTISCPRLSPGGKEWEPGLVSLLLLESCFLLTPLMLTGVWKEDRGNSEELCADMKGYGKGESDEAINLRISFAPWKLGLDGMVQSGCCFGWMCTEQRNYQHDVPDSAVIFHPGKGTRNVEESSR